MTNAAVATSIAWPQIPAEPIDPHSEFWKHECLACYLAHSDESIFISWQEKHARTPSFVEDIKQRMASEHVLSAVARELLRTVHHSAIRAWLQTLPRPHKSAWTARFNREKQALKEANYGDR